MKKTLLALVTATAVTTSMLPAAGADEAAATNYATAWSAVVAGVNASQMPPCDAAKAHILPILPGYKADEDFAALKTQLTNPMVEKAFESHLFKKGTVDEKLESNALNYAQANLGSYLASKCKFAKDDNGAAKAWLDESNMAGAKVAADLDKAEASKPAETPKPSEAPKPADKAKDEDHDSDSMFGSSEEKASDVYNEIKDYIPAVGAVTMVIGFLAGLTYLVTHILIPSHNNMF